MNYNKIGNSYRRAGNDYRELFFVLLIIVFIYLKFYFLECSVSSTSLRSPISAISSLGIILMVIMPLTLIWRRIRLFILLTVNFLFSGLAFTDLLHMRYYSDLFTFGNIGLSTQVEEVAESVFALIRPTDAVLLIDTVILIAYYCFFRHVSVKPFFKKITLKRFTRTILLTAAGASMLAFRIYSYEAQVPNVLRSMWDRPAVCNNVGSLTYHIVDFWNVTRDRVMKKEPTDAEIAEIRNWFAEHGYRTDKRAAHFASAKGKNLIIIQVESLQYFLAGMKFKGVEVTPNLNKFIKKSVLFSEVYNQTSSGNSSDAEFLVNAGLYPSASGVAYTRFAGNSYLGLPKTLAANGYKALALHGDRPGFWNRQHMYPALGIDKFVSKKDFVVDENIGMGLSDKSFFRQSLEMLQSEHKPFYAFMITLTSHYPYNFPELLAQSGFKTKGFDGLLVGNYLKAMSYFDEQFGMFVDGLKKTGLLDSSVIVVYGDHTAIPEWDKPNLEKLLARDLKSRSAWRGMLKIPLIIRFPHGEFGGTKNSNPAGLIDVSETVAEILGISHGTSFGSSIFSKKKSEPVIFRNGSYIYGRAFVEPSVSSAVDIKSGAVLPYEKYYAVTEEVKKTLSYSDKILENDLINDVFLKENNINK